MKRKGKTKNNRKKTLSGSTSEFAREVRLRGGGGGGGVPTWKPEEDK